MGSEVKSNIEFETQVSEITSKGVDAVPELVNLIIKTASELGASDIHLDPGKSSIAMRLRLDGVMVNYSQLPLELSPNIIARCKVIAGLLSYRSDIPQEGGAPGDLSVNNVELRISTFPTINGERISIRLFNSADTLKDLSELGFDSDIMNNLSSRLCQPEGMILVSGPSGSGKTTTLYASLIYIQKQSAGGRSIFSIEDPVENRIDGVTQTSINPAVGLDFPKSLSSLLRHDPEVIMLGEVRDKNTAAISVEAALTGHLVLSTVHAPRAAAVPHRLLDMGVEPYALAGSIQTIINQRLLRKLCSGCKCTSGGSAKGCDKCSMTGYFGRQLIAEQLTASEKFHDAVMEKKSRDYFLKLTSEMPSGLLEKQAESAVKEGITSQLEIQRILTGEYNEV